MLFKGQLFLSLYVYDHTNYFLYSVVVKERIVWQVFSKPTFNYLGWYTRNVDDVK